MFLDIGKVFEATWAGVPPHMSSRDFLIWRRWQEEHSIEYMGFYFDVAVGTPVVMPAGLSDRQLAGLQRSTVKRIDAVGVQRDRVRIIEVRPSASSSAGGSVLLYVFLLAQAAAFKVPMEGMIISDVVDPDSENWFRSLGLRLETVGPVLESVEV
jgi:hypothetical protein